ncbi:hypothetical protein NKH57_32670, partial [Mesorhizobium sp. M1050]
SSARSRQPNAEITSPRLAMPNLNSSRSRRWFPVSSDRYEQASKTFRRFGAWTLLFAWLPVVGDAFTIAAGTARVNLGVFVVLVAIGKAARYAVIIAGGLWAMA